MSFSRNGTDSPCILIINVHSTQNAGDAALLEMNLRQLRIGWKHPRFLICANYPEEEWLHQIPDAKVISSAFAVVGANQGFPVTRQIFRLIVGVFKAILAKLGLYKINNPSPGQKWEFLINAFQQADLVAAVSGNQFLSNGKYGWPFPLVAFPVWLSHFLGKPFYVMPQSIGPFKRNWERWIFKELYSRARQVNLRDQVSMDLAHTLGLPFEKVHFEPDPAFAFEAASRVEAEEILRKYGFCSNQPVIGLTIIPPLSRVLDQDIMSRYYRDLAIVLDEFTGEFGIQVLLFGQVTGPTTIEDDRIAGRNLLQLTSKGRVTMVDEVLSPAQLKACYGCMNLMIASRLHSAIFAMGAGVPTLVIGYFTKSRGLMRAMGLEEWMIEWGREDANAMRDKLKRAWLHREELASSITPKVESYIPEVLSLGTRIREDYQHGEA
jgi:colanic acid/amylovoran biosynthesis protein